MKAMKKLKKWWLPVVLILALTACGKDDPISEDGENITPQNNLKTEKEEKSKIIPQKIFWLILTGQRIP